MNSARQARKADDTFHRFLNSMKCGLRFDVPVGGESFIDIDEQGRWRAHLPKGLDSMTIRAEACTLNGLAFALRAQLDEGRFPRGITLRSRGDDLLVYDRATRQRLVYPRSAAMLEHPR